MKLSRQDPYRRRRSPLSLIVVIALVIIVALLVLAWSRGGPQPVRPIEKPIAAERLGK
jgi:hypothetical protein